MTIHHCTLNSDKIIMGKFYESKGRKATGLKHLVMAAGLHIGLNMTFTF